MSPTNHRLLRPKPSQSSNGFNPAVYGDLSVWLDASDVSTVTLNNGNVSAIDNKGAAGGAWEQATAVLQPPYVLGDQNSLNVISIQPGDGSRFLVEASNLNSIIQAAPNDPPTNAGDYGWTLFFAASNNAFVGQIPRTFYTSVRGMQWFFPAWKQSNLIYVAENWWCQAKAQWNLSNPPMATYDWEAPSVVAASAGRNWRTRINETIVAPEILNFGYNPNLGTGGPMSFNLFNNQTLYTTQWTGKFFELLVYRGTLSAATMDEIAANLKAKWGIVY